MNIVAIIPARMASTRFPGKPLARILGIPMIGHVYLRSAMSRLLNDVYIATCDNEIMDYAGSINAKAVTTKDTHERASDRAAEAVSKIEHKTNKKVDIVVMIQGDEPMLFPQMIDLALGPMLKDSRINVVNLMAAINDRADFEDPNTIKVTVDKDNFALYFSREPIPSRRKYKKEPLMLKQVCIIPFRRDFLIKFSRLKATPLEIVESVDMLRILENGNKVKMVNSPYCTFSVDTIDDLRRVEQLLKKDRLFARYKNDLSKIRVKK